MPTNWRSQPIRVTTGFFDTVNDEFCGGGSTANTALAPGQLGARVTIGLNAPVNISLAVNRYEGTFQYVRTLSTDTVLPALGLLAFWSDRTNYIVTTLDTYSDQVAGVFLNSITKGNYGFIKTLEGGRTLVNFGANTPAAEEWVYAATDGTATANRNTAGTDTKLRAIGTAIAAKSYYANAVVALKGQQS